ncbi:Isoflavone 2'-hydroxylase [Apostasia shenzhenica]|uniref:Isoflavone 2'-hydroxylase n=1 Tax=Apostasia shenzhenica TaxID=1088818 RepID=A0A2I0BAC9_9ASPA|nr:Isoflavone 2'-hydroxylase [Apostasia shenzhenica]
MVFIIPFVLPIFLLLLVLVAGANRRQIRRKNLPPSPPALPFFGHLYLLKKPLHHPLAALSAAYGPIVSLRFGSRPVLLVSSASAADECFSKNDLAFANRPRFLAGKHLGYDYTTLVWASYGPRWRDLRRITAAEVFSVARLDSFSAVVFEEVAAMVKSVAKDSRSSGADGLVELRPRLFDLTLNLMMRMISGKRFSSEGSGEGKRFREIVRETFEVSGATNLADFLPLLRWFDYKGVEKQLVMLQGKRDAFFKEVVESRRKQYDLRSPLMDARSEGGEEEKDSVKPRKCLIDVLLSLQTADPKLFTDEFIKGVVVVLLSSGTETSALTMEWALALLLTNPTALAKARAELDSCVGGGRLLNDSDLCNLPYLHYVIRETLRLKPVAAMIPAHESGEDCTVGGYTVKQGTTLLVNAWAINRDPGTWPEPEVFRPERWKEEGGGGKKSGKTLMFGMGRRACPGEGMAMRVVAMALGALLQSFEWDVDGGGVDLSEGPGLSMPMATPLRASCRRREFGEEDDILFA